MNIDLTRLSFVRFTPTADIKRGRKRAKRRYLEANEQNAIAYENLPHARSVAHQISLLPPTMIAANVIHS